MADDRIVISSEPGVTADEVARRSFPVVFRGFEQDEVRRFLHKVGDELRAAREREQELRLALDEARSTLAHPELDEATLTAALGEETARILRSAREAANDIRTKAEERVARMVQEADEHGARLRAEAENVLARRVEEADEVAANIRAAAEADAQAVHDRVQGEIESAKARGREMIAEAQAVRERIIGDLARRRRAAQIQIEQLLAGRDRLLETYQSVRGTLDDITAELAGAEDQARVAAEAAHHRVVSTPPDDSDLAAYAASGVEESAAPEPEPEPEPEQEPEREREPEPEPESLAPAPDAWALPEPPVHPEPHVEPFDEEEGVRIIGPVTRVTVAPPQADPHPEPELLREPDPTVEPEPEPEPELVAESQSEPAPVMHQQAEGSVDDLFARLREEREAAVINAEKVLAPDAAPTVDEAPVEAPEVEPAVEASEETVVADGDRLLLERRDECIEPVAHDLVRRLKRVLQDEQNEILDRLRQSRGRTRPEEALPSAADQAGRYRDAATGALADAAHSGASFIGGATAGNLPARQWAQAMADELVGGLRDRVTRSLAAAGEGAEESDAADSLGAAYRQWKTERIEQIARHHLAAAFNQGILAGAPDGSSLRWVFGDAGPCPDCDDNALAGPTQKGESYPTGQPHPPAHAGCGCLLTPSEP